MPETIIAQPLEPIRFSPFGTVIEKRGSQNFLINEGKCVRHHALATADVQGEDANVIINIFSGQPYDLPLHVKMVERHPLGSQAFFPLGTLPWLVIACSDNDGIPTQPRAFLASANQGISFDPNVWHGVLTPLGQPCDFLVVDRGGSGENLQEHLYPNDSGFIVTLPQTET